MADKNQSIKSGRAATAVHTVPLSQSQIAGMKANMILSGAPYGGSVKGIRTGVNTETAYSYTVKTSNGDTIARIREGKSLAERFSQGTETKRELVRAYGVVAKYTISTDAKKAIQEMKTAPKESKMLSTGMVVAGKVASSMTSSDDLGTEAAGGVITTGIVGVTSFRVSQKVSEVSIKSVKRVGNGVYEVTTTAGKGTIAVARTVKTVVDKQGVLLSKDTINTLRNQAKASGFNDTRIVKEIQRKIEAVKTKYHNTVSTVKKVRDTINVGAKKIHTAVDKSVKIVHGIKKGTYTANMAKAQIEALRKRAFSGIKTGIKKGVKTGLGYAVRGASKGATVAVTKGVPKAAKGTVNAMGAVGAALTSSEDMAVQGVGYVLTGASTGIRTAVTGVKATKHTVKTAVKVGKTAYKGGKAVVSGLKFIRNNGLRAAWGNVRHKIAQGIAKAGGSVVSALLNGVKMLGNKLAVPLVICCAAVVAISGVTAAPTAAAGSIFGGFFGTSDTNEELNVRDYLLDQETGVSKYSAEFKQNLLERMEDSKDSYDIVRFYSNTGSDEALAATMEGINSVFPSDAELASVLQPMFNAVILMEYDLEPSEREAAELLEELFNQLFTVTPKSIEENSQYSSVEYCGQDLSTGQGEVTDHSCGFVHALDDCPNYTEGQHTQYICSECDAYYFTCNGHKGSLNCGKEEHEHSSSCETLTCTVGEHTHNINCYMQVGFFTIFVCEEEEHTHSDACYSRTCGMSEHTHRNWTSSESPGCYSTTYHEGELTSDCGNSTENFRCTGYRICAGHSVISYTLTLDGVYALEQKYFTDPIDLLSNIPEEDRTKEETEQLRDLKDYYEIYQEMMAQVTKEYTGGLTMADLAGIDFIYGTRVGNQDVVDLALSQFGQQGGQPYWSYYGFSSRVEWCACFVHWCMRNTPSATSHYPSTANNAYCQTVANYFKSIGQWGDRNYTNLSAGDTIFFDWDVDGHTDHIGIVIGRDATSVYTVEGNSGDEVKVKSYTLGSSIIYGYGLMDYE